jgi:hypothetical protein
MFPEQGLELQESLAILLQGKGRIQGRCRAQGIMLCVLSMGRIAEYKVKPGRF